MTELFLGALQVRRNHVKNNAGRKARIPDASIMVNM
jgi:hypothetical protein